MVEALDQMAQQFDFKLVARREIGVAAFGCQRTKMLAVVVQDRLSQTGAGGDQRLVPRLAHGALVERTERIIVQGENTVGAGFKIVEQGHVVEIERPAQLRGIDHPG